jgi:hypothetical protein
MKERILYEDDFEKQLKEKSDQFKMYPSDKVWNSVYSNLHTGRRRFVAGMTFLISGILILAGTQLIFPSRNIPVKSFVSKINGSAKPAIAKVPHPFTSDNYPTLSSDHSGSQPANAADLNLHAPFIISSYISPDSRLLAEEKLNPLPEAEQNTSRVKPIQPADLKITGKTASPLDIQELADNEQQSANNARSNPLSPELTPEKLITQLSHIRNDRFSWELYVTPNINTHYLYGPNYQTMSQNIQSTTPIRVGYFTNVSGLVDNTPLLGYDIGGNILYRITKNISLKAGLAFSFSRYYIKAYNSSTPQAAALLSSYQGYVVDSLMNLNTGNGTFNKNPQHYQNRYYQLSVPMGVEMKVAGNGKLQLHLGATIQPSYLLNTDTYVLSNDYINYLKSPQAFRRWNLNVGGEVYLSYAVGKIRWELGPQVKYQLFSTYKNSYPMQENMTTYGIRIGISKTIR